MSYNLGPAVGQFIASSPTLFPGDYVAEMQACLDNTPAVPWTVIRFGLCPDVD